VKIAGLEADGRIRVDEIAAVLADADMVGMRVLVAMHLVNNETGVVQPLAEIERLVGSSAHYLFVDAVQALGKLPLGFASRPADMMALSAHKIGGPAGVGALLVKGHADVVRLVPGGGQEQGRRGGTESAALIAGFGAAAATFPDRYREAGVAGLVEKAEEGMRALVPGLTIFGGGAERIGNVTNFAVPGLGNAVAMMGLDLIGLSVSSGSACSSGKVGPSHVLQAMGVSPELAGCALRVSLGWSSSIDDVATYLKGLDEVVGRHLSRRANAA
jgi:cysteine desulfurase